MPPTRVVLRRCAATLLAGVWFAAVPASLAGPSPFASGDLYLLSRELPTIGDGIVRVDPVSGVISVLVDLPDGQPLIASLSYDAHRDRLLFLDTGMPLGVRAVDAAGAVSTITTLSDPPTLVAARGDGIVYVWLGSSNRLRYLDQAGGAHDVLNAAGTAAFTLPPGTQLQEMIYHPGTNSLLCLSATPFSPCAIAGQTCCVRIPLTPGGTQVAGAVSSAQVDVSAVSQEDVDGASLMPGGSVLVIVDTNDNLAQPRMQALDPAAMTFSTFASNGPYTGAGATDAGTWSTVQGKALILDTHADVLRSFGSGETGTGTIFATGVSGPGSSDEARLVEIVRPAAVGAWTPWGLAGLTSVLAASAAFALLRRRPTPR